MFGKNEIVGQKYFADTESNKLLVTSIFYTLQGEGPFRGEPAVFVRLSKCNLACSFCDTYFDSGDWMTFEEIRDKIEDTIFDYFGSPLDVPAFLHSARDKKTIASFNHKRKAVLVISGGEPTLQKNLTQFCAFMSDEFHNIQIESNGTVYRELDSDVTLVISPKCSEKHGKAIKYLEPNQHALNRADCLKFVMSADPESPYHDIPDWAHNWAEVTRKPLFISPMNIYNEEPQKSKQLRSQKNDITLEDRSQVDEVISFWEPGLLNMAENQKNHEYAARYCAAHGYTLNLQIHLYASLA